MGAVVTPFPTPLVDAVVLARRKRFLADVRLQDGSVAVAHCPNSGRMTASWIPGGRVWLSAAQNPKRKLPWTWEVAFAGNDGNVPVLVNTAMPNRVVAAAIAAGEVPELRGFGRLRREVVHAPGSRCDIVLDASSDGAPTAFVEVKNVTLWRGGGVGAFPDAVSERGQKHLAVLTHLREAGHRAVLFYLVSRSDIDDVRPADDVDPVYGRGLRRAVEAGVEVMAWSATISRAGVSLGRRLSVTLPGCHR